MNAITVLHKRIEEKNLCHIYSDKHYFFLNMYSNIEYS